ncbi:DUF6113 family protein [Streptomyces qinglanensis]|uniref:DUF6113 family protein n=1 Tax=Streptomyces qinglanensis TaxID=943816 RepID=UPI003D72D39A
MSAGGLGGRSAYPRADGARIAVYAALVLLGLLTGVAGALVQGGWFPLGLLLALAAAAGLFWGGATLCRTKAGAAAPAAGWAAAAIPMAMISRAEGDFLYGAGISSYVFLFGGMLVAVTCTTIALPAPPVSLDKNR